MTAEAAQPWDVEACVFDAYGTLFDLGSALSGAAAALGDRAEGVAALWRRKQLEYAWLRSLMDRYADFWAVTGEALDHALAAHGIVAPEIRARLMSSYLALKPYPDVRPVLAALHRRRMAAAILSNGTRSMLTAVVSHAGITALLAEIISVDEVGVYKPHPAVYQRAVDRLGVPRERICFLSSNGWDVAGAATFGFRAVWVNRAGAVPDCLPARAAAEIRDLSALPALLGVATEP
ncbi:MAG: haloacid dehalogenase type II [Rhodospirillaceae bacterium]|nr:haloacid dehalogenase type II [Rhodospirillaceae bacterium]